MMSIGSATSSRRRLLFALGLGASVAFGATAAPAAAQQHDTSAAFHRLLQVYDPETQEGIEGVQILDKITGNSVRTSPTGHVVLVPQFVRRSGALLVLRKIGYDSIGPLFIDPQSDTTLLIPMSRATTTLPKVEVNAHFNINTDAGLRDGFARRCTVSTVACVTEDAFTANPSMPLSGFLTKMTGILPNCGAATPHGKKQSVPSRGGRVPDCVKMRGAGAQAGELCIPTFYVDGFARGYDTNTLDQLEEFLAATDVKGMEVYLSGEPVPLRLGEGAGNVGCGSVVIWTK